MLDPSCDSRQRFLGDLTMVQEFYQWLKIRASAIVAIMRSSEKSSSLLRDNTVPLADQFARVRDTPDRCHVSAITCP